MAFDGISHGSRIFVDTNVLVYHFTAHAQYGQACSDLLDRIEHGLIDGFTSAHMVGEMAHRMMTIEASQSLGWPFQGIAYRLRQNPDQVRQLAQFQTAVDALLASRLQVLPITAHLIAAAAAISRQTGLLSNDALVVAAMQAHALNQLASNDADFDRVPGITRYAPA
jgi:predicted nucleic acid-binding protein